MGIAVRTSVPLDGFALAHPSSSSRRRLADTYIQGNLREALALNGIVFGKDWTSIERREGMKRWQGGA